MNTKLSDDDIKKLRDYFASQKDVIAVYLYGSFANGNTHKGSDLDIAVLFEPGVNLYERLGRLHTGFPKLSIKAEPEVRNIDLNQSPVFLQNVLRGKCIFSSDESKQINFAVAAMNIYRDTEYLRKLKFDYMDQSFKEGTCGHRLFNR